MKRLIAAISVVLVAWSAFAVELPREDAWLRPMTMWERYLYVPDAIRRLASESRLPLEASAVLRDRKLMAFVADRPLRDLLEALADALGAKWEPGDRGTWRLIADPERRRLEDALSRRDLRKVAEASLARWIDISQQPYEQIRNRTRALQDEIKSLAGTRPQGWDSQIRELSEKLEGLTEFGEGPAPWLAARVLRTQSATQRAGFWRGEPTVLTFRSSNPPDHEVLRLLARTEAQKSDEPAQATLVIAFDPNRWRVTLGVNARSGHGRRAHVEMVSLASRPSMETESALDRSDAQWANDAEGPSWANDPALGGDLAKPNSPRVGRGWRLCASDLLEDFASRSGVPVVGEALRLPVPGNRWIVAPVDGARWLTAAAELLRGKLLWRDGFVRYRPRHAVLWRASEPPERELRALEARAVTSLDDLAAFAAASSEASASRVIEGEIAGRIDWRAPQLAMPALRFWASLTPGQRTTAFGGEAIPFSGMNVAQRQRYMQAVFHIVLISPVDDVLPILVDLRDPAHERELGFYLERTASTRTTATDGSTTIEAGPTDNLDGWLSSVPNQDAWTRERVTRREVRFFFGFDAQRSVQYFVSFEEAVERLTGR